MFPSRSTVTCIVALIVLLGAAPALAVTTQIPGGRDTMLSSKDDKLSNGSGVNMCIGRTGDSSTVRGLVWFDIAGAGIPAGSTVTSVTLDLYLNPPSTRYSATVNLHRLTEDWGEGGSNAPDGECKATTAQNNDATWRYRFYNPNNEGASPQWSTLGGTFLGVSAARSVGPNSGHYTWTSAGLVADVQAWLDGTASNFGWIVRNNSESGGTNAVRFATRNTSSASQRPVLTVTYTPPAVTGACCFPAQECQELSAEDCGTAGGTFRGDGTDCTPNECPPDPIGACCASNGSCTELSELACQGGGHVWQGEGTTCGDVECPMYLEPFVDPLPIPAVAQPVSGVAGGAAHYEMSMRELQQQLHRDLPPTTVWGFGDGPLGAGYPGPTIEARSNVPLTVDWINDLRDTSIAGDPPPYRTDHYLAVDGTEMPPACHIHGAQDLPKTVVHVHGAHVQAESDGYPEHAYLPGELLTYSYANRQLPATLWYHDHALGITRLNVYMGLAGFYLVRDAFEEGLGLPTCPDPAVRETCFESGVVIQDRKFHPDGSLRYPEQWQDHFFGDKILVNGKVWPYLDVAQGKYRLRLTNGCTSRTLTLRLDRSDLPGDGDMPFLQIGAEGGLFEEPLPLAEITLAPAERADVIVDFELLPPGTEVLLTNSAPAPYPGTPGVGVVPDVMKFVVQDLPGHTNAVPAFLRPLEVLDELSSIKSRDFVLDKENDACGSIWKINGLGWDDITEYPQLGTTEVWHFINDGNMMHPMHMHLVMFQVLDRTPIGGGAPIPPEPNEIGWKDTARAEANMITRVIARFEDYPGLFAYHCHILEHEDHEMMRQFYAVDAVQVSIEPTSVSWTAQPGAVAYDVVRGDLGELFATGGNYALPTVTTGCVASATATTSIAEATLPAPGQGLWYLVRSRDTAGGVGTYDSGSSFQVDLRDDEIAASGNDCSTAFRLAGGGAEARVLDP